MTGACSAGINVPDRGRLHPNICQAWRDAQPALGPHPQQDHENNQIRPVAKPTPLVPAQQRAPRPGRGERLSITRPNPLGEPAIHHQRTTSGAASEVVRRVRPRLALRRGPPQPKRLSRDAHHIRIEVQQHQPMPFQPRLIPDVSAGRSGPPTSRHGCAAPYTTETGAPAGTPPTGPPIRRSTPHAAHRTRRRRTRSRNPRALSAPRRAPLPGSPRPTGLPANTGPSV